MPSENLNLTAQIVMSHASMRKLTPKELIMAIKGLYATLASLEAKDVVPEPKSKITRPRKPRKVKIKISPEAKAIQKQEEEGPVVGDPEYMDFMSSRAG